MFNDQVKTILKNGWFSDFKILEMHPNINCKHINKPPNTVTETLNTGNPEAINEN